MTMPRKKQVSYGAKVYIEEKLIIYIGASSTEITARSSLVQQPKLKRLTKGSKKSKVVQLPEEDSLDEFEERPATSEADDLGEEEMSETEEAENVEEKAVASKRLVSNTFWYPSPETLHI